MIFIDTAYFISLLEPRDELRDKAIAWARALREPLLTTDYVLWETLNFASKPVYRHDALLLLNDLQKDKSCKIVPATARLFGAGIDLFSSRPDKHWSITDCISFRVMEERKAVKALAYDRHFEQAGFYALLRGYPDEND